MRSLRLAPSIALVAVAGVIAYGCDNGAVGVDACRSIESKKCEAVIGCPGSTVVDDGTVQSCKTFYRDQCLFGIAENVEPDPVQLEGCLLAIDALVGCKGAPTLAECATAPPVSCPLAADGSFELWCLSQTPADQSACGIILRPEHLDACAFLRPAQTAGGAAASTGSGGSGGTPSDGGGGAGGTGGGGAGGTGGG